MNVSHIAPLSNARPAARLPDGEAAGEYGGQFDGLFGGQEFVDDFVGAGKAAVAPAVIEVFVEGLEGVEAEAGLDDLWDAEKGIGFGLLFGGGDVPHAGDFVSYGF